MKTHNAKNMFVLFLLIGFCGSNIFSQTNIFKQETLTGNWGGLRTDLEDNGIELTFSYTGEVFSNVSGGIRNKTEYLDNVNLQATLSLDKIMGWKNAQLFIYGLGNSGGMPVENSGAVQGISNIETYNTWKLYEFWLEQSFLNDKLSLLFGMFDLNSEFDVRETSGIFLNPSHGIGADYSQSGQNGPSIFPTTSLALRIKYSISSISDIRFAVFDGISGDVNNPSGTQISLNKEDGVLIAGEINLFSGSREYVKNYFKYAIGGWYYSEEFVKIDVKSNPDGIFKESGNYGIYAFGEHFLYSEKNKPEQGLAAFFRVGMANTNFNQLALYFGAGINYIGIIPGRNEDIFGIAIAMARCGDPFRNCMSAISKEIPEYETNIELTYNFALTPWLRFQPDFQYIINPFDSDNSYALAIGSRFEVLF